ncbi:zinc-binding alcohol dehydrogenase family protein [uncultured Chitinophaga sp.]|uniref:quinone oxidoreductase family protein n=1 Tax=uncultured Chitinophaga sp. TaxID=339340 RepID=UPI00261A52DA|nr:zinc-binding alcohol dehydrogenase family protein [uncultured Chitinophaga sp.]
MKAAVMYQQAELPQYAEVPEPLVQSDRQVLVSVKAAAVKQLDRGMARGKHYASGPSSGDKGRVPGSDGICLLPDGRRVYAIGMSGMLAEKAVVDRDRIVPVPDALDDVTAAALPNAVFGAAMALTFKAGIRAGDVVLINGATGVTGRVAVQLAKYYGAGRVIVTGRNRASLESLRALGADEIIVIAKEDETFKAQLALIHTASPIDIVIDYLWGHTAEMILAGVKGNGSFTNRIRYVSVGSMAGDQITLSAAILRSVDLQLTGSGMGSWSKQQVRQALSELLPEMFALAAEGKLKVDTVTVKLEDIEKLWDQEIPGGHRLVVTI